MNILDINIKGSFKFQLIFFLSCAIHITFLVVFMIYEIYFLAAVNIFSVLFYFSAGIATVKKKFEPYSMAWILSTYIEITAHAVLATLWLDFGTCFFLYGIIALVVSSYVVYLSFDKYTFVKVMTPLTITSFATLIFCFAFLTVKQPLITIFFDRTVSRDQLEVMRGINVFLNFTIIFFFTLMFIAEMHHLMGQLEDINHKLNYTANHDALTDLYNRHSLKELFEQFKKNFRANEVVGIENENAEQDDNLCYCVMMGDVDNFKSINDTFGHSCGDLVLKGVASVIKNAVAENEIACRWGGEEFLVLMHGSKEECIKRADQIRQKVSEIHIEEEEELSVTLTLGLVYCTEKKDAAKQSKRLTRIDELVQIADSRLYVGKSSGKNVVIYQ